ncbi:nucleolar [Halobacteriales archaeon SW_5_70_135]|nr:MAG: nucleolar [Halobacteriales archaeon SW_5_70_135]
MEGAWFAELDPADPEAAASAVRESRRDGPADWPGLAVERGVVADREAYYDALHAATTAAARAAVAEHERADDRRLVEAVRALDDTERVANELAERVAEWAGDTASDGGAEAVVRTVVDRESEDELDRRLVGLAERAAGLYAERDELRATVERVAPTVAPNLAALAGPVLAARLTALAGDLESLARMPAGTVQVLGAENALFAHLRGHAPSPKHGVIYTHEYVRGTDPEERGSAARALAGKLAIAARIDHYAGDRRPELERDLDERIARVRERTADGETEEEP